MLSWNILLFDKAIEAFVKKHKFTKLRIKKKKIWFEYF